jgi:hypothetical protein
VLKLVLSELFLLAPAYPHGLRGALQLCPDLCALRLHSLAGAALAEPVRLPPRLRHLVLSGGPEAWRQVQHWTGLDALATVS